MFDALDIPFYYYLIAIGLGIVIGLWKKEWRIGVLVGYIFFILTETVLVRKPGALRYELIPLWSWNSPEHFYQIMANIILFIPIGFLLGKNGWKGLLIAAGLSMAIELIQLITHRGLFEFDDIIHNTLGAVIGFGIWSLAGKAKRNDFW